MCTHNLIAQYLIHMFIIFYHSISNCQVSILLKKGKRQIQKNSA